MSSSYTDSDEDGDEDLFNDDLISDEDAYITYNPEMLEQSDDVDLSTLTSSDIHLIANRNELTPDQINMNLYQICPEFFSGFEEQIELSRYTYIVGNVANSIVKDVIVAAKDLRKRRANKDQVILLAQAGVISGPIPNKYMYQYIVINKYKFPVKIPDRIIERINKIRSLDLEIKQYIISNVPCSLSEYPFEISLHNEEILFDLDEENVKAYATKAGMIIPLMCHNYAVEYYLDNINHYRNVNPKSTIVGRKPDAQIFKSVGVYFPYISRFDLINSYVEYISSDGVVVFTMQNSSLLRKAKNKEITTMESLDDLIESKERIICIGNVNSFNCVTCSELIQLWQSNVDHHKYKYSLPYNLAHEMSNPIYNRLILLLKCYGMSEEVKELTRLYEDIRNGRFALVNGEEKRLIEFKKFDETKQADIKQFFILMFECGMYFRRWLGPEHPYPMFEFHTTDEKIDPFILATPHLNLMKDILSKHRWIGLTPMVNNDHDGYYITDDQIHRYFYEVYNGENCIRVASTQFISTAERSLRLLFDHRISNFHSRNVHRIS